MVSRPLFTGKDVARVIGRWGGTGRDAGVTLRGWRGRHKNPVKRWAENGRGERGRQKDWGDVGGF